MCGAFVAVVQWALCSLLSTLQVDCENVLDAMAVFTEGTRNRKVGPTPDEQIVQLSDEE